MSSFIQKEIDEANERYADKVVIQQTPDARGWGLYAEQSFQKGDVVMQARSLQVATFQDSHSIQIGWGTHILVDLPARFVNHICGRATLGIQIVQPTTKEVNMIDFVALQDIAVGDELLWDYESSEYVINNFACACGSPVCRKQLRGFRHHGEAVVAGYGGSNDYIAPYLLTEPPANYVPPYQTAGAADAE
jgi:hypothetical protein